MPPKKDGGKKADQKVRQKVAEDRTFGLKNKKKSAKVQKFVQEVNKQVTGGGSRKDKEEDPKTLQASKKALEQQKKAEIAELFKPIQSQKVPFGTDPKTVLCAFFKAGQCTKGDKCKFSHDLNIERKSAKIDLYTDKRAQEEDTMDTWDLTKLESVITSKHGNPRTTTDIICKYFIEAIEGQKYGWFWTCPNGGDVCKYRHALPPGYVLKKKDTKQVEEDTVTLEEFLETERHKLGPKTIPITYESFQLWKKRRLEKAAEAAEESRKAKENAVRSGRRQGLSGRDLFTFSPESMDTDETGEDDDGNAMDLSHYIQQANEDDRVAEEQAKAQGAQQALNQPQTRNNERDDGSDDNSSAVFTRRRNGHEGSNQDMKRVNGDVELDESLFEEEDLENLDINEDGS